MNLKTSLKFLFLLYFLYSCSPNTGAMYQKAEYPNDMVQRQSYYQGKSSSADYKKLKLNEESNVYQNKQVAAQNQAQNQSKSNKQVYTAEISLEIRSLKETQDRIIKIMEDSKGFIVSQAQNKMVIRVPSEKFQETVKEIIQLGIVLDKKIFTYDVTEKYFDIQRRLELSEKAKARLLDMLAKVKKVEEKVKIIEEIQRITKEIEYYKQIISSLDSFINYSMIEIILNVPQAGREYQQAASPFPWINQLNIASFTLSPFDGKKFEFKIPGDFLIFDKESYFIARNPKGCFIRIGKTSNNPNGNTGFWYKALNNGMKFKNYEIQKEGKAGPFQYALFEYKSLNPFYYFTALTVFQNEIILIETFSPDSDQINKYLPELIKALENFRFKP